MAADLHHILDESRVGAVVEQSQIPVSEAARNTDDDRSPLEHALGDGEDFELLFTVDSSDGQRLLDSQPLNINVHRIGTIVDEPGCTLIASDGERTPLPALGWRHAID